MSARPLTEAVQQAQEAISGGRYDLAVETCRRVLGQFPEFATAHRLLGEAYLEQGDTAAAERAFYEAVQRDPQSTGAYVGLGTIADQRGETQTALAYYQAAWEIAPQRAELRDRLVQVAERLYGPDGRLHPTRAALASLHFEAGRWSRVVSEATAVLAEHPSRLDVRLRLAEALWRRGDDDAAAQVCQAILEQAPKALVALLILADVERRRGNQDKARSLLNRARTIDPDGVRAADLIAVGADDLAEFLLPESVPVLEDRPESNIELSPPRIAPAPDFMVPSEPVRQQRPIEEEQPFVAPVAVGPAAATEVDSLDLGLPTQEEVDAARPSAVPEHGYTDILQSFEVEGLTPFSFDEGGEIVEPALSASEPGETERRETGDAVVSTADERGPEPFSLDNLFATVESDEVPAGEDRVVDQGLEEDAAAALTTDWASIDREIETAIPSPIPSGYTDELRLLDESGFEPFALKGESEAQPLDLSSKPADESEVDAGPWFESATDTVVEPAATEEPAIPSHEPFAPFAMDWSAIDREIQSAVPSEMPRGFTDELRLLDESGIEPFEVERPTAWQQEPAIVEPETSAETAAAGVVEPVTPADESELSEEDLRFFGVAEAVAGQWSSGPVEPVEMPEWVAVEAADEPGAVEPPAEAAGVERPGDREQATAEVVDTPAPEVVTGLQLDELRTSIERLGVGVDLFNRARAHRAALVEAGRISGETYLPGTEPQGPTLESVESDLSQEPDNVELRLLFAGLLADAGERSRGLEQFRWLYRRRVELPDDALERLTTIALGTDAEGIGAHQLLGAYYRRSGNLAKSAGHYELSLEAARRLRAMGA